VIGSDSPLAIQAMKTSDGPLRGQYASSEVYLSEEYLAAVRKTHSETTIPIVSH